MEQQTNPAIFAGFVHFNLKLPPIFFYDIRICLIPQ